MRLKVALMVPVAGVLGFIAVQAGRHWVDRQVNEKMRQADSQVRPLAQAATFGTIVVAAAPLRFGMELTPAALREIPWPDGQTPKGAFAKISDLLNTKGKRVVISAMDDNEPILAFKITGPGQRANLAGTIEEGMKAVTVRVDDVVGVAGFVLPGDRVDVMLTRQDEKGGAYSDMILQNLKVLAIDQVNDDRSSKPTLARNVTLEVATAQAQRVIVAQKVGAMTLVLRPLGLASKEPNHRISAMDLVDGPQKKELTKPVVASDDDGPVASVGNASVTVNVIRRTTRQEYSVPATRKE